MATTVNVGETVTTGCLNEAMFYLCQTQFKNVFVDFSRDLSCLQIIRKGVFEY